MISRLVGRIAELQSKGQDDLPRGNFPSSRYHPILPIRRDEDNVYFVSWILQLLKRTIKQIPVEHESVVANIIYEGELAINNYRNRYGDKSYNFYRPNAWFPNGKFLSKSVKYQPTDDADDTSIAMRGKAHTQDYAREIKDIYIHQSNGLRARWIKRTPLAYRRLKAYNTWIGSEGLFVDFDLVVMANILVFNAQYDLGMCSQDHESIEYIRRCIESGDAFSKPWAVSCWYPSAAVILYSLADLLETKYYPQLEPLRKTLITACEMRLGHGRLHDDLPLSIAYIKLAAKKPVNLASTASFSDGFKDFTFGVVPLTHPYDGTVAQFIGQFSLCRLHYECEAQWLAMRLELELLLTSF